MLAVFAYISCVLLWLVALLPYGPGIIESDSFETFVPSETSQPVVVPAEPTQAFLPQWLLFVIVAALVAGMLVAVVISLKSAPKAIGQTGQKFTHHAAEAIIPVITHHRPLPAKKRKLLTARIIFYLKMAIIIIPLIVAVLAPTPDISEHFTRELLLVVVGVLAGWSLFLFCLQLIGARLFRVSYDTLW